MKCLKVFEEFYRVKVGLPIERERRSAEDLFLFLIFSDFFGLPNSHALLVGELLPLLLEDLHRWHKRLGLDHSPLDWLRCC